MNLTARSGENGGVGRESQWQTGLTQGVVKSRPWRARYSLDPTLRSHVKRSVYWTVQSERCTLNLSGRDHDFLMVWGLKGQEKVQQHTTC